jgi:cytochrome c5
MNSPYRGVVASLLICSSLLLAGCGAGGARNLYDDFKHVNPDSSGVRQEYVDGKVLTHCSLDGNTAIDFGWLQVRMQMAMGGETSPPSEFKIYVLSERMSGVLMNVKFIGRANVDSLVSYAAIKGCNLEVDNVSGESKPAQSAPAAAAAPSPAVQATTLDRVPEVVPQKSPEISTLTPRVEVLQPGKKLYSEACQSCHATGMLGAPRFGDTEAWAPRLEKPIDTIYANAINGKGAMLPKGGSNASDDDVKAAVDYMAAAAK